MLSSLHCRALEPISPGACPAPPQPLCLQSQCCPPVTQPVAAVTAIRFVNASSLQGAQACGPNAADAGATIGTKAQRMCVTSGYVSGKKISANDAGKFISNVTVVIGQKPWAELKCPPTYIKLGMNINDNGTASVAICIKRAPAGASVSALVKSVIIDSTCKMAHGAYVRLPFNLNGQTNRPAEFICLGR